MLTVSSSEDALLIRSDTKMAEGQQRERTETVPKVEVMIDVLFFS